MTEMRLEDLVGSKRTIGEGFTTPSENTGTTHGDRVWHKSLTDSGRTSVNGGEDELATCTAQIGGGNRMLEDGCDNR